MKIANLFIFAVVVIVAVHTRAQEPHKSIHQLQYEKYKNQKFQVEIPELAKHYVPLQKRENPPSKAVFGFHPYWMGTAWQDYDFGLLTTIAYFGADVNSSGDITNFHSWPANSLINTAHSHGVKVVLTVILFRSSEIAVLLNSESARQNLINNLLGSVQGAGADGVNIDFEGMPSGQRDNFVTLIQDLTAAFHSAIPGSQITIDMPAVDWGDRFAEQALADASDGLIIMAYDYHWSTGPTAGPVSPLISEGQDVTETVDAYLANTENARDKIILGLPWYGYQWLAEDSFPGSAVVRYDTAYNYAAAEPLVISYGKIRYAAEGQIPWFRYPVNGNVVQCWYDDSLSLSLKYNLAAEKNLGGIGIWALGYDGRRQEMWDALGNYVNPGLSSPATPGKFYVRQNTGGNGIVIGAVSSVDATLYRIYFSEDGETFTSMGEFETPVNTITSPKPNLITYFRMTASNSSGESAPTEVLAVVPGSGSPKALIVNGFDRMSGTTNTRDFVRQHGQALWDNGVSFDATSNEALIAGAVNLNDYEMVDWILGEEGSATSSFTSDEQLIVENYLENGGNLFVSGSEIGYDLFDQGDTQDQNFYHDYLKAEYVSDAANHPYGFYSDGSNVFDGLGAINFDDGTHSTYNVDYPDGIKPAGGAQIALKYSGVDYDTYGGAGILFTGTFGTSNVTSSLVYISLGFETIYPISVRTTVMNRIIDYFQISTSVTENSLPEVPRIFALKNAYPNPFNSDVTITYSIPDNSHSRLVLHVYDLLGREVASLFDGYRTAGEYAVRWNGKATIGSLVSSGVYLVAGQFDNQHQTLRITYLK